MNVGKDEGHLQKKKRISSQMKRCGKLEKDCNSIQNAFVNNGSKYRQM